MAPTSLSDLPSELLLQITDHLHEASSIARLERTNKKLRAFADQEAWKSFVRHRFPTTCPHDSPRFKDTARTLTTLSQALDRRAYLARCIEPSGIIRGFPGARKIDRWKRPRGQTIGFTPHIDVYEDIGPSWRDREEILAFSAGAEVCLRQTSRTANSESSRWTTYKPLSAHEGRDDITCLHIVHPSESTTATHDVLTGTANGDLQLISLPRAGSSSKDVKVAYFTTQGMPVRSSSLMQEPSEPTLLAASLGDSSIALYEVDRKMSKTSPSCQVDLKPVLRADGHPASQRIWTTSLLSSSMLGIGIGPSTVPIQIFIITQSGITRDPFRKFSLENDVSKLEATSIPKPPTSSVYTMEPLPSISASGSVFLSGAYDGIVRLHDLRSQSQVEKRYVDSSDDSPIYSILPRGQEKMVVGTGRHNLLKVFDLRMGAKCYNSPALASETVPNDDFNVYLRTKPSGQSNNWSRSNSRSVESSVYSLASSSPASPYIYAGLENAIMSLALTETFDSQPDTAFFQPWAAANGKVRSPASSQILDLAMHDHGSTTLYRQRSPYDALKARDSGRLAVGRLDARWKSSAEVDV